MLRFEIDYAEGAYLPILERMVATNNEQEAGYGMDSHCEKAREIIKKECKREDIDIHFLVGGTQTNTTVISSVLRPHQGVLSAQTGHISTMETGAIESINHKVLTLPDTEGKIFATQVEKVMSEHLNDPGNIHKVQPGMVYISQPTELGTLYSKKELADLSEVCHKYGIPLFADGARLGYAIEAAGNDVTLEDMAKYCDIFYIGATKGGGLCGEAVVITKDAYKKDFRYIMKQRGALMAKGRVLGIQFEVLLEDGAYFTLAKEANRLAVMIAEAFEKKGYQRLYDTRGNLQFFTLPNTVIEKLSEKFIFTTWEKLENDCSVVRFSTSWASTTKQVECLIKEIESL